MLGRGVPAESCAKELIGVSSPTAPRIAQSGAAVPPTGAREVGLATLPVVVEAAVLPFTQRYP